MLSRARNYGQRRRSLKNIRTSTSSKKPSWQLRLEMTEKIRRLCSRSFFSGKASKSFLFWSQVSALFSPFILEKNPTKYMGDSEICRSDSTLTDLCSSSSSSFPPLISNNRWWILWPFTPPREIPLDKSISPLCVTQNFLFFCGKQRLFMQQLCISHPRREFYTFPSFILPLQVQRQRCYLHKRGGWGEGGCLFLFLLFLLLLYLYGKMAWRGSNLHFWAQLNLMYRHTAFPVDGKEQKIYYQNYIVFFFANIAENDE